MEKPYDYMRSSGAAVMTMTVALTVTMPATMALAVLVVCDGGDSQDRIVCEWRRRTALNRTERENVGVTPSL